MQEGRTQPELVLPSWRNRDFNLERLSWLEFVGYYTGKYWMVCLGNEQRSFCRFWDCIGAVKFKWSHSFGCKTCFLYLVQNSNYHLLTITCSLTLNKYLESIIFSWCLLLLSCNYSSWVLSVLHQNYFIRNNLILHLFFRVWILTICRRYWICLTHLIFQ